MTIITYDVGLFSRQRW